jgi:hypothetical protein
VDLENIQIWRNDQMKIKTEISSSISDTDSPNQISKKYRRRRDSRSPQWERNKIYSRSRSRSEEKRRHKKDNEYLYILSLVLLIK